VITIIGGHKKEVLTMDTAKLFRWGRSQTRRLPKDYWFQGDELAVKHFSSGVLLLPVVDPLASLEAGLA